MVGKYEGVPVLRLYSRFSTSLNQNFLLFPFFFPFSFFLSIVVGGLGQNVRDMNELIEKLREKFCLRLFLSARQF